MKCDVCLKPIYGGHTRHVECVSLWRCPICGHTMTEAESKGYKGCPTGFHFAQHRKLTNSKRKPTTKPKIVYAMILGRMMRCEVIPADLDTATPAELETIATTGSPEQRQSARAILLDRARELARAAAQELTETTKRLSR